MPKAGSFSSLFFFIYTLYFFRFTFRLFYFRLEFIHFKELIVSLEVSVRQYIYTSCNLNIPLFS